MLLVLGWRAHVNAEDSHHHVMCYVEGLHEIPAWRVHVVKWNLNSFIHGNSRKHSRVQIIFRLFFEDFSMFLGFFCCVCEWVYDGGTMKGKFMTMTKMKQLCARMGRVVRASLFLAVVTLSLPEKRFIVFVCGWLSELVVAIVVAALSLMRGKSIFGCLKWKWREEWGVKMFSFSAHNNELNR